MPDKKDLLANPAPHCAIRLVNSEYWRIAVGEYGIVYRFDDACLYAVTCGRRTDGKVYRSMDRNDEQGAAHGTHG